MKNPYRLAIHITVEATPATLESDDHHTHLFRMKYRPYIKLKPSHMELLYTTPAASINRCKDCKQPLTVSFPKTIKDQI